MSNSRKVRDREPIDADGMPLYFSDEHNAWFERKWACPSGTVGECYRNQFGTPAQQVLDSLSAQQQIAELDRRVRRDALRPRRATSSSFKPSALERMSRGKHMPRESLNVRGAVNRDTEALRSFGLIGELPFESAKAAERRKERLEAEWFIRRQASGIDVGEDVEMTDTDYTTDGESGMEWDAYENPPAAPSINRSNARRERWANTGFQGVAGVPGFSRSAANREAWITTGNQGTAGISGVDRSDAVREMISNSGYQGIAGVPGFRRTHATRESDDDRPRPHPARRSTSNVIATGSRSPPRSTPKASKTTRKSSRLTEAAAATGKTSPKKKSSKKSR